MANFHAALPGILGGIFDTLCRAIPVYQQVRGKLPKLPRMASFATWGYAIAEALGTGKGTEFLAAYSSTMNQSTLDMLESNSFMMAIVDFMETGKPLEGTFEETLTELRKHAAHNEDAAKLLERDRTFPKTARSLRKALERMRIPLLSLGIDFKILDGDDRPHKSKCKAWVIFSRRDDADAVPLQMPPPELADLVFDEMEVAF